MEDGLRSPHLLVENILAQSAGISSILSANCPCTSIPLVSVDGVISIARSTKDAPITPLSSSPSLSSASATTDVPTKAEERGNEQAPACRYDESAPDANGSIASSGSLSNDDDDEGENDDSDLHNSSLSQLELLRELTTGPPPLRHALDPKRPAKSSSKSESGVPKKKKTRKCNKGKGRVRKPDADLQKEAEQAGMPIPETPTREDLATNPYCKPEFTISSLILRVMCEYSYREITLDMIYASMMRNYAFYRKKKEDHDAAVTAAAAEHQQQKQNGTANVEEGRPSKAGWKNTVRHALSTEEYFFNCKKKTSKSGRGGVWSVDMAKVPEKVLTESKLSDVLVLPESNGDSDCINDKKQDEEEAAPCAEQDAEPALSKEGDTNTAAGPDEPAAAPPRKPASRKRKRPTDNTEKSMTQSKPKRKRKPKPASLPIKAESDGDTMTTLLSPNKPLLEGSTDAGSADIGDDAFGELSMPSVRPDQPLSFSSVGVDIREMLPASLMNSTTSLANCGLPGSVGMATSASPPDYPNIQNMLRPDQMPFLSPQHALEAIKTELPSFDLSLSGMAQQTMSRMACALPALKNLPTPDAVPGQTSAFPSLLAMSQQLPPTSEQPDAMDGMLIENALKPDSSFTQEMMRYVLSRDEKHSSLTGQPQPSPMLMMSPTNHCSQAATQMIHSPGMTSSSPMSLQDLASMHMTMTHLSPYQQVMYQQQHSMMMQMMAATAANGDHHGNMASMMHLYPGSSTPMRIVSPNARNHGNSNSTPSRLAMPPSQLSFGPLRGDESTPAISPISMGSSTRLSLASPSSASVATSSDSPVGTTPGTGGGLLGQMPPFEPMPLVLAAAAAGTF